MKAITFLFFFISITAFGQEYKYLMTVEGVDVSSQIKNDLLYIAWKNNNNEKIEVSFDFLVWTTDSGLFVQKMNGGGFTLNPGELIRGDYSGSFWTIPKNYNVQNLRFKLDGLQIKYPERKTKQDTSPAIIAEKPVSQNSNEQKNVAYAEKKSDVAKIQQKNVSQYNSTAQQTVNSDTNAKMLAARDYANSAVGLNSQQIQTSKELAQNVGDFATAIMKIGNSKREAEYARAERRNEGTKKDALNGNVEAMKTLYVSYRFGKAKDYYEARHWLDKAAEANDCESIKRIVTYYHLGNKDLEFEKNDVKAFEWSNNLFLAAKQKFENGDSDALEFIWDSTDDIARCYHYGKGVEKNIEKYLEWLSVSVDYKNVDAAVSLSDYYKYFGVNKNREKYLAALDRVKPIISELEKNVPDLYTSEKGYKHSGHASFYESMGEAYSGGWFEEAENIDYAMAKKYFEKAITTVQAIYGTKDKYGRNRVKALEKKIKLCDKALKN